MSESKVEKSTVASRTNIDAANSLAAVQSRLDRIVQKPVTIAGLTVDSREVGWPAQYQALKDPPIAEKSRVYRAITQSQLAPAHPVQVVIPFGDADVQAWKEKESMVQQVEFDQWISSVYRPFDDPAEAEWLQKMYPEYFEARIKENESLHELQAQWAKIQIQGPKSKEDLYLMFRVEQEPSLGERLTYIPGVRAPDANYTPGMLNRAKLERKHKLSNSATEGIGRIREQVLGPPFVAKVNRRLPASSSQSGQAARRTFTQT